MYHGGHQPDGSRVSMGEKTFMQPSPWEVYSLFKIKWSVSEIQVYSTILWTNFTLDPRGFFYLITEEVISYLITEVIYLITEVIYLITKKFLNSHHMRWLMS